jgi:hypothetical protein
VKQYIDCARLPRDSIFVVLPRKVDTMLPRAATSGNMVSTLRGKAKNIASRGSRAQSIHGLREARKSRMDDGGNKLLRSIFVSTKDYRGD